jgi:Junction-mediating and -regulatory protein
MTVTLVESESGGFHEFFVVQVMFKWNVALAELYNYLLQPFLDSRELALGKVREAKAGIESSDSGSTARKEFEAMFHEWRDNYVHAVDSVQELYIEYYSRTVKVLTGVYSVPLTK